MTGLDDVLSGVFEVDGAAGAEVVKLALFGHCWWKPFQGSGEPTGKKAKEAQDQHHNAYYIYLVKYIPVTVHPRGLLLVVREERVTGVEAREGCGLYRNGACCLPPLLCGQLKHCFQQALNKHITTNGRNQNEDVFNVHSNLAVFDTHS